MLKNPAFDLKVFFFKILPFALRYHSPLSSIWAYRLLCTMEHVQLRPLFSTSRGHLPYGCVQIKADDACKSLSQHVNVRGEIMHTHTQRESDRITCI